MKTAPPSIRFARARLLPLTISMFALATLLSPSRAAAEIIVISNRTPKPIEFTIILSENTQRDIKLRGRHSTPLVADGPVHIRFKSGDKIKNYPLAPNSMYYFGTSEKGTLDLGQIGLEIPIHSSSPAKPSSKPSGIDIQRTDTVGIVKVAIFVDDEEVSNPKDWEKKLRSRVASASKILEATCRMRLQVVSTGTWKTDNSIDSFNESLIEFEKKVSPDLGHLAIGFTSQFASPKNKPRLGGTHGLLRRHILIRENRPGTSERERLEVLLHEVGHTLGAVHSPEADSIMRPNLGDNLSNDPNFQITFDPLNAFAMNLVSEAWRFDGARSVKDLKPRTVTPLRGFYVTMVRAKPDDNAASRYLRMLGHAAPRHRKPRLPRSITELPPE